MSPVDIIVIKKRQSSKACSKVYVNVKKNIVFFIYPVCRAKGESATEGTGQGDDKRSFCYEINAWRVFAN